MKTSSWLGNFLSQKRDLNVAVPDDHILSDDTYLREFSLQFTGSEVLKTCFDSDEDCDVEALLSCDVDENPLSSIEESPVNDFDTADQSLVVAKGKLKIFNLPYRVKPKEITDLFSKYGFTLESVVVDIDKRTSLPTGSASVELDPGSDPVEAIKALQGQTCGGRPMKVLSQKTIIKKSRPSGGRADRYFLGGDVVFDVKCNSCGKGGHKTVDCDAGGQLNPCHLCAAKDHESGDCPNITCFRCGEFGHHSKACYNSRKTSRAYICTICASSTHDSKHCMQLPEKALARMVDSSIRCMQCNKLGHALCEAESPVKKLKPRVYCPNCGEEGHHVDYSAADTNRAGSILGSFNACKVPRYDAYIKFPQLLRGLDRQGSSSSEMEARQEYYQSLVWSGGSGEQVQSMFPSLNRMKVVGGNDQEKRRSTMSAGDLPSRGRGSLHNSDDAVGNDRSSSSIEGSSSRKRRDSDRRDSNSNSSSSSRHSVDHQQVSRLSHGSSGRKVQSRGDDDHSDRYDSRRNTSHRTVFQDQDKVQRRTSNGSYDMGRDGGRIARRY